MRGEETREQVLTKVDTGILLVALVLLAIGGYLGLVYAPPELYMGDVYRILYAHVPAAWMALLGATVNLVASLIYLFRSSTKADAVAEASGEVALLFGGLLLGSGMLWAYPTWGVFWSWDPRLTSAAILFFAYAGYGTLRRFVEVPEKRAMWSAVLAIIIYIDIPLVWFSVKWWNSLHQVQSSPNTMSGDMVLALRVNALAFLAFLIFFIRQRYVVARARQSQETSEPPARIEEAAGWTA